MLAGLGEAGAPVKFELATTCLPSGRKVPLWTEEVRSRQPVRWVQEPGLVLGATGGRGSSVMTMGSGCGAMSFRWLRAGLALDAMAQAIGPSKVVWSRISVVIRLDYLQSC